jgi:hypothetical protein
MFFPQAEARLKVSPPAAAGSRDRVSEKGRAAGKLAFVP